jgi:hypothetical protein
MKTYVRVGAIEVEFNTDSDWMPLSTPLPLWTPPVDPRRDYDRRMGIEAKHHQTVGDAMDATWIIDRAKDRIVDKVVIEIGAGVGHLALELARHAKHVFAIEVDCEFSREFAAELYKTRPRNLTWIFDRAESMVDILKGEVAMVVTGSDDVYLRELAGKFAPDVILPWQDWNHGKARISGVSMLGGDP